MSLQNRIQALEEATPPGYTTYATDGQPVIQSYLSPLEWLSSTFRLFASKGRKREKAALIEQLERSATSNAGLLHEYLLSVYASNDGKEVEHA